MKLSFIKNIQFTRLIKIDGKLKEFNFRKPNANSNGIFTVDVLDHQATQGNRIIFRMEKTEAYWKIVPQQLPNWIIEKESEFDELINEELAKCL